ncbi:unnamed protein product [Bursaphelenchus okinawaensis]|uniref:Uncharacterized protein n=1 Tax=Bursaphelenchus okinawaensis TaxID=465554 RepID=A0A811JQN7_9BILA|nr:unnamed protein product [Bursaphelenchus okinawaensis]CAG9077868.1 unnamed protein product [Bursaphelenchus okinawaensis]
MVLNPDEIRLVANMSVEELCAHFNNDLVRINECKEEIKYQYEKRKAAQDHRNEFLESMVQENESLDRRIEEMREKRKEAAERVAKAKIILAQKQEDAKARAQRKEEQEERRRRAMNSGKTKEALEELQKKSDEKHKELASLDEKKMEKIERNKALVEKFVKMEAQKAEVLEKLEQLRMADSNLTEQLEIMENTFEQLKESLEECRVELESAKHSANATNQARPSLYSEVMEDKKASEKGYLDLCASIRSLKASKESLESQLKTLEQQPEATGRQAFIGFDTIVATFKQVTVSADAFFTTAKNIEFTAKSGALQTSFPSQDQQKIFNRVHAQLRIARKSCEDAKLFTTTILEEIRKLM